MAKLSMRNKTMGYLIQLQKLNWCTITNMKQVSCQAKTKAILYSLHNLLKNVHKQSDKYFQTIKQVVFTDNQKKYSRTIKQIFIKYQKYVN